MPQTAGKTTSPPFQAGPITLFVTVTNSRSASDLQLVRIDGELEVATDAFTAADTTPAGSCPFSP